jgi:hypothetical protein
VSFSSLSVYTLWRLSVWEKQLGLEARRKFSKIEEQSQKLSADGTGSTSSSGRNETAKVTIPAEISTGFRLINCIYIYKISPQEGRTNWAVICPRGLVHLPLNSINWRGYILGCDGLYSDTLSTFRMASI